MHCFRCDADSTSESGTCELCGKPLETDPDRYFKAGMEAMAEGRIGSCISFLGDCVLLSPDHVSAHYNLGLALCLANKCDEAIEHLTAVADRDPSYPGIYTALGQAAFGSYLSHIEQAESSRKAMVQLLMKAIEEGPNDVDAYFSLGNAYIAIGSAEKSLPWLRHALRLHPDSSAIYFAVAKAFKMLEKYPEAAIMARRSMEFSNPNDPLAEDIRRLLAELQETAAL